MKSYSDKTLLGNWYESRLVPPTDLTKAVLSSKNCLLPDLDKVCN